MPKFKCQIKVKGLVVVVAAGLVCGDGFSFKDQAQRLYLDWLLQPHLNLFILNFELCYLTLYGLVVSG